MRMLHDASHCLCRILAGAGLQEEVAGGQLLIARELLTLVHDLHFVHPLDGQGCSLLGRTGHPVDALGQRARAISFDADIFARFVQQADESLVYPKRRLSTGQDDHLSRTMPHLFEYLLVAHHHTLLVLCVAEGATQVAAREADEESRRTGMVALTLQAVEYLVNLSHK